MSIEKTASTQRAAGTVTSEMRATESSIVKVVNALTGSKKTTKDLAHAKLTEDVLFTALVYQKLQHENAASAKKFLFELRKRFDQNTRENDSQPLFRAVNEFLSEASKEGAIKEKFADDIVAEAFGKAQLDHSKSFLSRRARGDGIDAMLQQTSGNKGATKKQMDSWEKRLETKPTISPGSSKSQRRELDKVVKSMTHAATTDPGSGTTTNPSTGGGTTSPTNGTPETDKTDKLPRPEDFPTGSTDFVYKPKSEKDGKALFILPERFSGILTGVEIYSEFEEKIETLTPRGRGSDNRWSFSSKESGSHFGSHFRVRLTFIDNTRTDLFVSDGNQYQIVEYA